MVRMRLRCMAHLELRTRDGVFGPGYRLGTPDMQPKTIQPLPEQAALIRSRPKDCDPNLSRSSWAKSSGFNMPTPE